VIGDVGQLIAQQGLNIADFRLGRDNRGQALAVVRIDGEIPRELIEKLAALPACLSVKAVAL
jgi:D-3-phosphoglycerate dehydrogenase